MLMNTAVSDLLLEWEQREEQGCPVTPEELCGSRPELLEELKRYIGLLRSVAPLFDLDDQPTGEFSLPTIPGFEILGCLGSGGMGVVYEARDTTLDRIVAIKIPHRGVLTGRIAKERFERESRVLAQLQHPNIVPVHAAGLADALPYFVMDFSPRGSLVAQLPRIASRPDLAVNIIEKVARAVEHAHQRGILHRDLKPSNILLDGNDQPLICDFGVAALFDADTERTADSPSDPVQTTVTNRAWSRLTSTGVAIGTPAYMAPEQFDPALGAVGPATDVWALGVILYEMLTGEKPFVGSTHEELRERICRSHPLRPRSLRHHIDRALEAIVLRCLEKNPRQRFASAATLADRLSRYRRAARRRRWGTALLAGLALVAVGTWNGILEMGLERRYERQVTPVLARLQRGEAVDLIRPGGEAPAFMVRCGEGITKARMTEDGFTVTTPALGLVEFLPRIPVPRYRLHAEFRHDRTQFGPVGDSGVGIMFTGRHLPSPDGMQHVVAAVAIDDWSNRPHAGVGGGVRSQRLALLQLIWYLDTPTDGRSPFKHHLCYPPKQSASYTVPSGSEAVMHSLVIDVTPEGTTAVLGDSPEETMGPLLPDLFSWFSDRLHALNAEVRDIDLGPLNQPAVGVLVSGGQCTLKRLRVVPQ
jgi:serine/threonine-protein kinase